MPTFSKIITVKSVNHLTGTECNKWGTYSHREVSNGQDAEIIAEFSPGLWWLNIINIKILCEGSVPHELLVSDNSLRET